MNYLAIYGKHNVPETKGAPLPVSTDYFKHIFYFTNMRSEINGNLGHIAT